MKLFWADEIRGSTSKYYTLKRQTPTLRPFLPPHSHDYAELFYLERGSCTHRVNDRDFQVSKGDLLFIGPHDTEHCILDYDKNLSLLQILFQEGSFSFIHDRYESKEWDAVWNSSGRTLLKLSHSHQKWFENSFNTLLIGDNSLFEIERFLINLLGIISDTQKMADLEANDSWLNRALKEIQEPVHFVRGVQGFVALCGRSQEHVEREVKKHTNQTVTDVVNQARMTWASYMLLYTNAEITDIAFGCGFNSVSYFYNLFKTYFSKSPSKYRKSMKDISKINDERTFASLYDSVPGMPS